MRQIQGNTILNLVNLNSQFDESHGRLTVLEILDFLIFHAKVEDEAIRWLENQSFLFATSFLAGTQKGKNRVVCLDLQKIEQNMATPTRGEIASSDQETNLYSITVRDSL